MQRTVILRLDGAEDPISGTVSGGEASPQRFAGYVELIAALERLRSSADADELQPPAGAEAS